MGKNLGEVINNIMEENASERVVIMTNHLYITGEIHEFHDKCQNCHDCLIALKDVKIANLKNLNKCKTEECDCNGELFTHYKWFNISVSEIVGFSILSANYNE